MAEFIKLYVISLVSILLLDFVWLGLLMNRFYVDSLRPIARLTNDKFDPMLWAVAGVYILLALGIVEFALPRLAANASWFATFRVGAVLGLIIYAVYDLTNYSLLKDWPLQVTLVDIFWGAVLAGTTTLIVAKMRELF